VPLRADSTPASPPPSPASCCLIQDYVTDQQRGFRADSCLPYPCRFPFRGQKLIPKTGRLRWLPGHIPGISHCILAGVVSFFWPCTIQTVSMAHLRLVYDSCQASSSLPRGYILSSFLGSTLTFWCLCACCCFLAADWSSLRSCYSCRFLDPRYAGLGSVLTHLSLLLSSCCFSLVPTFALIVILIGKRVMVFRSVVD